MQAGEECLIVRNDEMDMERMIKLNFDSIIISPGPKAPADAGLTNQIIATYWQSQPILGICLGHQAIGEFFGAKLTTAARPMHGKTSKIHIEPHPVFERMPSAFNVMRYHSLILTDLPAGKLNTIAETADGEIMAIAHTNKKIVGMQFHPESILTEYGESMIKNWFTYIR